MSSRLKDLAPTGLRWRLAGWVALVMMLCTAIVFVAVYRGTATQLRQQIDQEIAGDASDFAHNLTTVERPQPEPAVGRRDPLRSRPVVQPQLDAAVRARPGPGAAHQPP